MTNSIEGAEGGGQRSGTPAFMVELIRQREAEDDSVARALDTRAAAAAQRAWQARAGSRNSSSVVVTFRLGREDFAALHRESVLRSVPPSVLVRNLVRLGLTRLPPSGAGHSGHDLEWLAARVRSAAR